MDCDGNARRQGEGADAQPPPAVSLRPLGLEDVDAFMAWASDERVMRHLKRPLCASREEAVAQIRDTVLGHPWFRAICVEGGRPVGQVSVWPYPDEAGHRPPGQPRLRAGARPLGPRHRLRRHPDGKRLATYSAAGLAAQLSS
jgi:hypothetical protein